MSSPARLDTLLIVSRKSRFYAGPRYQCRGIDEEGNVANEVETEQTLFSYDSSMTLLGIQSYLVYRGSIPLRWRQDRGWGIKPAILIDPEQDRQLSMRHLERLRKEYGVVHIHNLIKTNAIELAMKEAFESLLNDGLPKDMHYNYLDFLQYFNQPDTAPLTSMVILQTFREYKECLRVLFTGESAQVVSRQA